MPRKYIISASVLVLMLLCSPVCGQQAVDHDTHVLEAVKATNCEAVSTALDDFIAGTDVTKNIIIIAYRGENDTYKDVELRRLHNAKTYIVEMFNNTRYDRPAENVIAGRGTETRKEGQLDLYVDGRLKLSLRFLKNRGLPLQPCYIESGDYCKDKFKKMFYPCLIRK